MRMLCQVIADGRPLRSLLSGGGRGVGRFRFEDTTGRSVEQAMSVICQPYRGACGLGRVSQKRFNAEELSMWVRSEKGIVQ